MHLFCNLSQVYPAVILMYFISVAVILLESLALIVQVPLPYNKNAIPKHASPEAKGSNPTTGPTLLSARNQFRGNFNHWQVWRKEAGQIFFKQEMYFTYLLHGAESFLRS